MKKTILFGAFSLVIVSLAVLTTAPIPAQAQVAACPAGYVCTPIVQTASNCPAGYVCTPTNTSTTNTGGYTGGYGGYTGSGGYAGSSGTGSTVTSTLCYNWATNLSIGSTGSDVVALQTFLVGKGFDIKNVSNKWTAKGYFGNQTVSALKNYQTSVGLPVTGALDAATRAQMNSSCSTTGTGSTSNNQSVINVVSPKNGDTLIVGQSYTISWTGDFERGDEIFEIQLMDSQGKDFITTVTSQQASCSGQSMGHWANLSTCSYT